jgi:hypothetical protein
MRQFSHIGTIDPMNKKILYLVSCGSYSDYRVVAIFDDQELAEKLRAITEDANDLEEYELNPLKVELQNGWKVYRVEMLKDGTVQNVNTVPYNEYEFGLRIVPERYNYKMNKPEGELILGATVFAKDEKHAIKITNEKRAQLIANNSWTIGRKE